MTEPLQLVGEVDERDDRIEQLEEENRQLKHDLREARAEISQVRRENGRAIAELRRVLMPVYRGLQQVFGEMEAVGGEDGVPAGAVDARVSKVWESWKSRLGGSCAKVIDALLVHGTLNTQQLAIACGMNRNTIPKLIYELNKAGLINKNGGRFSLKEL